MKWRRRREHPLATYLCPPPHIFVRRLGALAATIATFTWLFGPP
jgi:hypothetical protein